MHTNEQCFFGRRRPGRPRGAAPYALAAAALFVAAWPAAVAGQQPVEGEDGEPPAEAGALPLGLIGGTDVIFRAVDSVAVVRVPLDLADTVALDTAWVVDVAGSGGLREQRLLDGVRVGVTGEGPAPAFTLRVDLRALDRPDTLGVRIAAADTAGRRGSVDLRVRRPAATLRDPGTIRVVRVGDDERITPLVLRETSGMSRLTGLRLESLDFTADDEPAGVGIALEDSAAWVVPAGGALALPYRVVGDPPIGTATGSAELFAPALAEPLVVQFEIVNRRSLWWLFWLILLGAVFGAFAKDWLEKRTALGEARRDAREMLARLNEERRRRNDADFRQKLDEQIEALEREMRGRDGDTIQTATETAEAKLAEAITKLETALEAAWTRLAKLVGLGRDSRDLPARIHALLAELRDRVAPALAAIEDGNAGAAKDALDDAAAALARDLRQRVLRWQADLLGHYDDLRDGAHGLPRNVVSELKTEIDPLIKELDDIAVAGADIDELETALDAVDAHRVKAWQLTLRVPDWVRATYDAVRDTLDPAPRPDSLDALRERIEVLREEVHDAAMLEDALVALLEPELSQTWETALREQADENTSMDELDERLAANEYLQAAELLAAPTGTPLGGGPPQAAPAGAGPDLGAITAPEAAAGRARSVVATSSMAAFPAGARRAALEDKGRELWEIHGPQVLQWIIFAAVIAAAGVILLGDDFVGGRNDIVEALLWGFSLDVTGETVAEKVKEVRS